VFIHLSKNILHLHQVENSVAKGNLSHIFVLTSNFWHHSFKERPWQRNHAAKLA